MEVAPHDFQSTRWGTDVWLELRGMPWDLQPKNRDVPGNFADEAAPTLELPRPEVVQGQAVSNFHALKSDTAKHGTTLGCKGCSFVCRSVRHSDECRLGIMEAEEDNRCPIRPAPEVAAGGGAAPSVAAPAAAVRTVGGAPSSSSAGGVQPSPMEAGRRKERTAQQRTVEQFSASGGRSGCEWQYS